jgi:DMSO/TMAO reductase YedYZ molybdopterin-dependent catalytic subunit
MPLFIVRHEHDPERCPAADPDTAAMLVNHLSRPNVRRYGVEIRGEAVIEGAHTLYMIIEAGDEAGILELMRPFGAAGVVEVHAASSCVRVAASGGCAAALPSALGDVEVMDAEEACQRAIDAGLVVHRAHPLNCETSIPALIGGVVMPNAHFYVRNHFHVPVLDPATWRLRVGGLAARPLSLSLRELQAMPSQSQFVTLECAGNGRRWLDPNVDGEQWEQGAVSTAEWTGVPLVEVLDRANIEPAGREVVFRGADAGSVPSCAKPVRFERSLQLDVARESEALLAFAMNGEPLPVQHGYPVRLVVPGWYGVASVKWLTEMKVIDRPFDGYFQSEKYQYEWPRNGDVLREPVTVQQVRSLITEPAAGDEVERGELAIRGVAWSGASPIARVEVSIGDGPWQAAYLIGERLRHSWQWWELLTAIERPGETAIRSRATDLAGRSQPEAPEWNRLGYGNNAIHPHSVLVR